ncbi:MAG: DUF2029 domain-containing protein [marine benthic group bacterium]|nr:DUF2029 domain-containing protein [Gemmatimonadota bacterium]
MTERRWTHLLVLLVGLLALAVLLARGPLLMNDFVEYWAAASLVLEGGNPYDPVQMLEMERSAGFSGAEPLLMLNPPPVLTLVLPFGAMPYRPAALLWLIVNTVALLWSVYLLWELAGGTMRRSWIAFTVGLFFVPSLFALLMGQISILILLGLALFLRFVDRGRMAAAGAASTLLLIKPHVVFLAGAAIFAWWIRVRDRSFLRGAAAAVLLCAVPLAFDPSIYGRYLDMGRVEPMWHFSTSTLGTMLRVATGDPSRFGFQFVPMVLGFAYLATRLRRYRGSEWNWLREMPALVTVSVATAAYGWVFDQVVLLVAAIPLLAIALRSGGTRLGFTLIFWVLITLISFEQAFRSVNSFWYFWMPHAFLLALLLLSTSFRHHGRRPSS